MGSSQPPQRFGCSRVRVGRGQNRSAGSVSDPYYQTGTRETSVAQLVKGFLFNHLKLTLTCADARLGRKAAEGL